jgi:hypothetical protein
VQPRLAGWRLRRLSGQAWRDEAERQGHSPAYRARMRGASNHGNPPRLGLRRVADALLVEDDPAPARPDSVSIERHGALRP